MSSVYGKVVTFTWKILNYSMCQLKNGEKLKSPVISTESFKDTKWYLTVYPKGVNKSSLGFISCFLYKHEKCEKNENESLTSCTLEILDTNGKILASMERRNLDELGKGLYKFLEEEQLTNEMENWKKDILEIRCQIFDANYKQQSVACEAQTEIQMKKYSFDWKVRIPEIQDWSKKVTCHFGERDTIDITLTAPDNRVYLKIQESREEDPLSELLKLKISIINQEGFDIGLKNSNYLFESSEIETSFEKNQLGDIGSFTSLYSFKLICTICISGGISTSTFVNYSYVTGDKIQQFAIPHLSLQKDFKNMLLNKEHCDLELHTENEMLPAHKCVLSARSPVFSAMFKRDMMESHTGVVDIPDVESEVLRSFVEFLYTDTFSNTDLAHVLKLMLVADKYQVDILKEGCSQILMSKISVENVCEVISVADLVNQVKLKHFALNYIKTNKLVILLSPEWSEWVEKNMKLAIKILTKLSTE